MGTRLAFVACAFAGCTGSTINPIAVQLHDRGIGYLNLAVEASDDVERRRLCDRAEQTCRLALEYAPGFAHAYNCLGLMELDCHRSHETAADHFKRALSLNGDFAEAHGNLGATFLRRTPPDHQSAVEQFLAALEIAPSYQDARRNLGLSLIHLHRWVEARAHLMRLLEISPPLAETHHHLGLVGLSTEQYEDAEYHLKQCLELEPSHPVCHYELGNVYLATERLDEAILEYIAALRWPSEIMIAARQNLREAYRRSGYRDGANMVLIDRCQQDPGNADCRFDLGVLFAERGLFEEAIREWRAAARLQPGYCSAHYRLAMEANRVLDTPEMERSCRETIACVNQTQDPRFRAMKEECVSLLRRISE